MNRRLIMIINDGGKENHLPGVAIDKANYLDFFHLPEGGLWDDSEIQLYENNATKSLLGSYILQCRMQPGGLDYLVIVFCGHGYSDAYGMPCFELSPENEVSLREIQEMTRNTRCLMIADSCRSVVQLAEGGQIRKQSIFSADRNGSHYRVECRSIYDEVFKRIGIGSFCIGLAASFRQTANEDDQCGGYYSYALLSSAKQVIECKKIARQNAPVDYESVTLFPTIHNMAAQVVRTKTNGAQIPELCSDGTIPPPFVVVPCM